MVSYLLNYLKYLKQARLGMFFPIIAGIIIFLPLIAEETAEGSISGYHPDQKLVEIQKLSDTNIETSENLPYNQFAYNCSGHPYIKNELLVRFSPGINLKGFMVSSLHQHLGSTIVENFQLVRGLQLIELPAGTCVDEAIRYYTNHSSVLYAQPNYVYRKFGYVADNSLLSSGTIPNDPHYNKLWGMEQIRAAEAWEISTGSPDLKIAVLDSGIAYNHEDLQANMWLNRGYNYIHDNEDPMDDLESHGTHVAGIIAAKGNNNKGVTGVMWDASLIALKIFHDSNYASDASVIRAFQYAMENGAKVINNSWGGSSYSPAMKNAIAALDAVVVFAAGNEGSNNDLHPTYPANYALPNLITVAATNNNDTLASFSNYGANTVHVAAPGVDIYSTLRTPPAPAGNLISQSNSSYEGIYIDDVKVYQNMQDIIPLFADDMSTLINWDTQNYLVNPWSISSTRFSSYPASAYSNYNREEESWLVLNNSMNFTDADYTAYMTFQAYRDISETDILKVLATSDFYGYEWYQMDYQIVSANGHFETLEVSLSPFFMDERVYIAFVLQSGMPAPVIPDNNYGYMSGTSMATPMVAGLAGLILSVNPSLTPPEVIEIIKNSVDTVSSLQGKVSSGGRINARKALELAIEGKDYQIGDVNGDGEIDIGDAIIVLRFIVKAQQLSNAEFVRADYNKDGNVNIPDVILILRKIVGLI